MPAAVIIAALAVVSTVGLVLAAAVPAPMSTIAAILTMVTVALLALRLRRTPAWAPPAAILATFIAVLTMGLPATLVLSDRTGTSSSALSAGSAVPPGAASPVSDASGKLRAALEKADELLPGGANNLLKVDIDEHSTRVSVLDLAAGQSITAYRSRGEWNSPSRSATRDRADATFRRTDIAKLDLTDTARRVTAAADRIKLDRSSRHASDGIEIGRRTSDKMLVVTFSMSGNKMEADGAGVLPDNLVLAQVSGMLPVADRLLRANGIDPTKPVISDLAYRSVGENTSSVRSANDQGTVSIRIGGGAKTGTLEETVGRFPEVRLTASSGSGSNVFALASINPAAIERARGDVAQRFSVPPIDAQALALEFGRDTDSPGWTSGKLPPVMTVKLGPGSANQAVYLLDGSFISAE